MLGVGSRRKQSHQLFVWLRISGSFPRLLGRGHVGSAAPAVDSLRGFAVEKPTNLKP